MAKERKEKPSNRWLKSERLGNVTLYLTKRSPYWWIYWWEANAAVGKGRDRCQSTHETDQELARVLAAKKNEELFRLEQCPELGRKYKPCLIDEPVEAFIEFLYQLGRTEGYVRNLKTRLRYLRRWMKCRGLRFLHEVTPELLVEFVTHLRSERAVTAATANDYVDAVYSFFGYAIYKKKLIAGPNPAATGRQATLDRLPEPRLSPPVLYPDQINAIIGAALHHRDHQTVNMIAFVCEGGFRFQELQFLQVGDVDLENRQIMLDVKKPDGAKVRPELRKGCLTAEGLWIPKSRAGRRPVHITDRLALIIREMGLGEASDWLFVNSVGQQVAGNKTLCRLKRYGLEAKVLVEINRRTGEPWSLIRWHWLRHYHRTRAHVSKIRREVSKIAMGHAGDFIHDHYRGIDIDAFHQEYAKFDSGIDPALLVHKVSTP